MVTFLISIPVVIAGLFVGAVLGLVLDPLVLMLMESVGALAMAAFISIDKAMQDTP